jgi:hypothetical protein
MTLLEKQGELRSRAALEISNQRLSKEQIDVLIQEFLPEFEGFCRFPKNCPTNGQPLQCANRCNARYWRDHNQGVARIMATIAHHLGADSELYYTAGLVHDLDYLRHPHDDGKPRADRLLEIHPMVEVLRLEKLGAPAELLLALIEHAPHTGCKPSGPMSHALIAADNIATFRAVGKEMPLPALIPKELADELCSVPFEPIDDDSTTQENRGDLGTQSLDALLNYHEVLGTLSDLIHGDRLVCLTGAGISLNLRLKNDPERKIPDWFGLVTTLYHEACTERQQELAADPRARRDLEALLKRDQHKVTSQDIIQAASILHKFFAGSEFDSRVKRAVTPEPGQTSEAHRAILDLRPRGVITWNYDDAHETALAERNLDWGQPLLPWDEQGLIDAIRISLATPFLLKAHGSISADDTREYSVVLTAESYRDLFVRQPAYRAFLQHLFTNFSMLIVGFGMADPDFDLLLRDVFSQFGSPLQNHVLIRSAGQLEEMKGQEVLLRRSYGIRTLYISDWTYLPKILRDAAATPGPKLRAAIQGCLDISLETRRASHEALRRLGSSGRAFATEILLKKLEAGNLSPADESELAYSLGYLDIKDVRVHDFLLGLLIKRSSADQAVSETVETLAHILSVIEPALRCEDVPALEKVLYELSRWPEGLVPDRRLEKYAEALICRIRAKFDLWDEPRVRPVHLQVGSAQT